MWHGRNTLWLSTPRTPMHVIQKLLKSHDFYFSLWCSSLEALSGSFFDPGNKIAELFPWGNLPLGSSYSKQTGILSHACWFLVQHLTAEHKNLSHTAFWHFWSSGYFPDPCRADCLGLSELDMCQSRIQWILLVTYRISGKDPCNSSISSAEIQDSLKITLKAYWKSSWPALFEMCYTTFLSLRGFQWCHTMNHWVVY